MHITREQIDLLVSGALSADEQARLRDHINSCPVCRALVAELETAHQDACELFDQPLSERARQLMHKLQKRAPRAGVIDLIPLTKPSQRPQLWAADGTRETSKPGLSGIMTLASEDPEVVLRILHDGETGEDQVQLIADDNALVSHVLVRLPDLEREYLTDSEGRARLVPAPERDFGDLRWQIKLPQAIFELEPVTHDPEKVEYSRSVVLESDSGDAVEVTLTGHTDGKQIALRILQVDGKPDFGPLRAVVSQNSDSVTCEISDARQAVFAIRDFNRPIHIRLFIA